MSFEAESNSELTMIVPAYQLHFRFPVQNKQFCRTTGPAYLSVLPVLVIFCPLGPTNFKKSGPYYILAKDAWKIPTIVFILVPLKFVFSHVPCKLYFCLVPVTL